MQQKEKKTEEVREYGNLSDFFYLLLQIDMRENPQRYKNKEEKYD